MTSNQPYLLRAFYEWIVDNNLTPHIVVNADYPGVQVPLEHVKNGQIVLNISPSACTNLHMGNVDVVFDARFGGVARNLFVPCAAVMAIYARENGAGTVFDIEPMDDDETDDDSLVDAAMEPEADTSSQPPKKGKPTLTLVK